MTELQGRPMHFIGSSRVCLVLVGEGKTQCGTPTEGMRVFPLAQITCLDCREKLLKLTGKA